MSSNTIVNPGTSLRYFSSITGNYCGEDDLPAEYSNFPDGRWSSLNEEEIKFLSTDSVLTELVNNIVRCRNCQISEKEIVLGDSKGNLYFKNLFTKGEVTLEKNHGDRVLCTDSLIKDEILLSGSGKRSPDICLWSVKDKKLMKKWEDCHKDEIKSVLFLSNNLFASCSFDCNINIVDYMKENVVKTFNSVHNKEVYDISYNNNRLFSCSGDGKINIFDVKNQTLVNKNNLGGEVHSILGFNENYLVAGDSNGFLSCFDLRNFGRLYKKTIT